MRPRPQRADRGPDLSARTTSVSAIERSRRLRVRGGQRLLLVVGRGMKFLQPRLTAALVLHRTGEIVGDEIKVARIGAPIGRWSCRDGSESACVAAWRPAHSRRAQGRAAGPSPRGFAPPNSGPIDAVGGPDQEAEDERRQEREKSNDRPDHVAQSAGGELFWQKVLQEEADVRRRRTRRRQRRTRKRRDSSTPPPRRPRQLSGARSEGNRIKEIGERKSRVSGPRPPLSSASLDEFVHLPRDGSDIEQRLDAFASRDREITAPIGLIQQSAERRRDAIGVAWFDNHRAWTAISAKPPRPEVMSAAPLAMASSAVRPNGSGPVVSTIPTSALSHAALTSV